jgi:2-iminobutanoate/2-iminopropanoate deaminase
MRGAVTIRVTGAAAALIVSTGLAAAQSADRVKPLAPAGAIQTTGTWGLGTRAGDFV